MNDKADRILRSEYGNSRNMMTPRVHDTGMIDDNTAYEISSGSGIFTNHMVGVSVVYRDPNTFETTRDIDDKSHCFSGDYLHETLKEAREYVKELQ